MKPATILILMLFMASANLNAGEPIKIMPVGNSITAGEHYDHPPVPERTGYRKDLYELLVDSGYNVDFVGSQEHGIRAETDSNWYDWNNEGYPGWEIGRITTQLTKALVAYNPDILLVHVGTNGRDWGPKPGQVMEMLDSINKYSVEKDHPITVFLCKIIERLYDEDSAPTSQFNLDVIDTVSTRIGDKIKIISVDMEDGAGLDYTDSVPDPTATPPYEGGDMWGYTYPKISKDKFHPNDKGYMKMAVLFYEELIKELALPDSIKNNKVGAIELSATTDSTLKITWTANFVDEEGYVIERSESGGAFTIVDTAKANSRYVLDTVADVTKTYKYRIKAFNASHESEYSDEVTYTPLYYQLSTSVVGQGTVSPVSGSFLAGVGTRIELTAFPAEGWEFKNWTGDITTYRSSNPTPVTINSDLLITANFDKLSSQVSPQVNQEYRFYPNPVTDKLVIELQNEFSHMAVIQLFDNTGKLILSNKVQGIEQTLDMGYLSTGIYLIKVTDNEENSIVKYITKL